MAKELSKTGISTSSTIQAGHVSQSIDALTGTEAYDITISGSLTATGSVQIKGSITLQEQVALTGVGSDSISSTGTNVLTIDASGNIYKTGSYDSGGGGVGGVGTLQDVTTNGASTSASVFLNNGVDFNEGEAGIAWSSGENALMLNYNGDDIDTIISHTGRDTVTTFGESGVEITGISSVITAKTGSFSYLTGSSPIVIDADNIKVSSTGVVSGISSIDATSLNFDSLPTEDPEVSGRLYRSGKLMQISTGSGTPAELELGEEGGDDAEGGEDEAG